jgi:hypothetical protein
VPNIGIGADTHSLEISLKFAPNSRQVVYVEPYTHLSHLPLVLPSAIAVAIAAVAAISAAAAATASAPAAATAVAASATYAPAATTSAVFAAPGAAFW